MSLGTTELMTTSLLLNVIQKTLCKIFQVILSCNLKYNKLQEILAPHILWKKVNS